MKFRKAITSAWVIFLFVGSFLAVPGGVRQGAAAQQASTGSPASVSTFSKLGPLAVPVDATASNAGTNYGLFGCQVGKSTGQCYDPYQMRAAYGVSPLIAAGKDGTGKTIVIVDAFQNPNIVSQVDTFNSFYGLPAFNAGPGSPTFTQVAPDGLTPFDQNDGNMVGWAEEISLDVEWAHAIAPGANIVLELSTDNSDQALISVLNDAVNNHRGDVVSMSFGEADTCLGTELTGMWHQAFVNATKKGITLFASAGDQGAVQPSCDGTTWVKETSAPASDPLVTGVGGTELHAADYCLTSLGCDPTTQPAPGTYQGEIGWNEGPKYGDFQNFFDSTEAGGGGFSSVWSEPSYQKGTFQSGDKRGVADVSYNAAILHGVLTYLNIPGLPAGFYRFGGTSAGAPQWAALTAIADQVAGHDFGFINAALYKIGQNAGDYAATFHDVTSGVNSAIEFDAANNLIDTTGYAAGKGYDAFTGLGSPLTGSFVTQLPAFWSVGQGTAAINGSKSHGTGHSGNNKVNNH